MIKRVRKFAHTKQEKYDQMISDNRKHLLIVEPDMEMVLFR